MTIYFNFLKNLNSETDSHIKISLDICKIIDYNISVRQLSLTKKGDRK